MTALERISIELEALEDAVYAITTGRVPHPQRCSEIEEALKTMMRRKKAARDNEVARQTKAERGGT